MKKHYAQSGTWLIHLKFIDGRLRGFFIPFHNTLQLLQEKLLGMDLLMRLPEGAHQGNRYFTSSFQHCSGLKMTEKGLSPPQATGRKSQWLGASGFSLYISGFPSPREKSSTAP